MGQFSGKVYPVEGPSPKPQEVFRIIDDGECVLTTLDPYKALKAIQDVMNRHDNTDCWIEFEILR